MKRLRISIEAEFEFADDAQIVTIAGERAISLAGHTVRPDLEFRQLRESNATSSTWTEIEEDVSDAVLAAERRVVVTVSGDDDAT